jgi:hypothetical protein
MKPSLNPVLCLSSAALLVQASVWFAHASPKLAAEPPEQYHHRGAATGQAMLAKGKAAGPAGANWVYTCQGWWERFQNVNLIGRRPPPPSEPVVGGDPKPPTVKPLAQIIELVSLAYDGHSNGKGGETHVVVRYLPDSGVKPPPEVLREFRSPVTSATVAVISTGRAPRNVERTATPGPAVPAVTEYVQLLRTGQRLWQDFEDVMLVEVSPEADRAWFVRMTPDGQPGTERMVLFKSNMHMSQQVQQMLDEAKRANVGMGTAIGYTPEVAAPGWLDVAETTRTGNTFHIGRNDAKAFDEDRFLERVSIDAYRSQIDSSVRGVQVRKIDAQLGATYGIRAGDVLMSVNDQPVHNQAQFINVLRRQYQLGTRTFRTKWLSAAGEEVERIYQAPPGRNDR